MQPDDFLQLYEVYNMQEMPSEINGDISHDMGNYLKKSYTLEMAYYKKESLLIKFTKVENLTKRIFKRMMPDAS